jgi:hypothetical protein
VRSHRTSSPRKYIVVTKECWPCFAGPLITACDSSIQLQQLAQSFRQTALLELPVQPARLSEHPTTETFETNHTDYTTLDTLETGHTALVLHEHQTSSSTRRKPPNSPSTNYRSNLDGWVSCSDSRSQQLTAIGASVSCSTISSPLMHQSGKLSRTVISVAPEVCC